jgi:NAD(P)-dependent dehydrogenase (short-subunit alcohol dehydrogenase family)
VFSLAGKACVVTGASRGLGRAIALAFAEQGADVALGARSRADLETVAREVEARGRRAVVQPTDVTDLGQIRTLADVAAARLGRIDVWVNNAGQGISRPPSELTDEDIDQMMTINVKSAFYGMQEVLPHFKARGTGRYATLGT